MQRVRDKGQPLIDYKFADDHDELLNTAFNILFEETIKKYADLTTSDN